MDLLAPWKLCLQCLPVFASEPVARLRSPLPAASEKSRLNNGISTSTKNPSENDFEEAENDFHKVPSFSDASLIHDHQHQDLPLSGFAKDVGLLICADAEMNSATNGDAKHVDHDINSVVQAPQDVKSTNSGSMPHRVPITPAHIGLGCIVDEHRPLHHIHHQVNSQHNKGHSFFHSHGHDKAPPLQPVSDSISNEGNADLPILSSQSEGDESDEEAYQPTQHQLSDKQSNSTSDDGCHASSRPQSTNSHVHGLQTTTRPMEKSHSIPAADSGHVSGSHGDTDMNGSSSTLETSQTELIDAVGMTRMRRRDQLKHQFRGLRNQLKQGGQHLKKEGSKHLQSMRSAMNKQAQQNEESGRLLMVPDSNPS